MTMKTMKHFLILFSAISIIAAGCKTMTKSQKGAAIGVAGGGAVGAVVGKALGNTAMGAIIGAAAGGVAGTIIGKKMDQQADDMKKVLDEAEVKRVGEGIVVNFKEKVLFGFDRSDLSSNAQQNLDKLVDVLKKYPDTNIEILGHTDNKGSNAYNMDLSQKRAGSAANYLKNNGISSSRIATKGLGETDPVATNDTDEGRAANRRVEFVITANDKMKADAQKEAGSK